MLLLNDVYNFFSCCGLVFGCSVMPMSFVLLFVVVVFGCFACLFAG